MNHALITPKIKKKFQGLKTRILPAGPKRIINVLAAKLAENLSNGSREPMIAIRSSSNRKRVTMAHHIEIINGHVTLCEQYEKPLPETNGRGICYLETDAAIRIYY